METYNPVLTAVVITGTMPKNRLDNLLGDFGLAGALTKTDTGYLLDAEIAQVASRKALSALEQFCALNGLGYEEVNCKLYRTIQAPYVWVISSAECGTMFHYQIIKSDRPEVFCEQVRERMEKDLFLSVFTSFGNAHEVTLTAIDFYA